MNTNTYSRCVGRSWIRVGRLYWSMCKQWLIEINSGLTWLKHNITALYLLSCITIEALLYVCVSWLQEVSGGLLKLWLISGLFWSGSYVLVWIVEAAGLCTRVFKDHTGQSVLYTSNFVNVRCVLNRWMQHHLLDSRRTQHYLRMGGVGWECLCALNHSINLAK